jgi:hypothetical protein
MQCKYDRRADQILSTWIYLYIREAHYEAVNYLAGRVMMNLPILPALLIMLHGSGSCCGWLQKANAAPGRVVMPVST